MCHHEHMRQPQHCDQCGDVIDSQAVLDYWFDGVGVDWALCTTCSPSSARVADRQAVR